MKSGQGQLDMTKVPIALSHSLTTSFAEAILPRNSHARIEGSIGRRRPIFLDVVQISVAYLKDSLIQYVLS